MIDKSSKKLPSSTSPTSLTITVWEAGAEIGYKPGTVKKLLNENRFPIDVQKLGRNRVCLRSDVADYVYKKLFGRHAPTASVPSEGRRKPGRPRKTTKQSV